MLLPLTHITPYHILTVPLKLILYLNDSNPLGIKLFSQVLQLLLKLLTFALYGLVLIGEGFLYVVVEVLGVVLDLVHEVLVDG